MKYKASGAGNLNPRSKFLILGLQVRRLAQPLLDKLQILLPKVTSKAKNTTFLRTVQVQSRNPHTLDPRSLTLDSARPSTLDFLSVSPLCALHRQH